MDFLDIENYETHSIIIPYIRTNKLFSTFDNYINDIIEKFQKKTILEYSYSYDSHSDSAISFLGIKLTMLLSRKIYLKWVSGYFKPTENNIEINNKSIIIM